MDEAKHGVDYHDRGCDVPTWLLVCLLLIFGVSIALVAFLMVVLSWG